MVCRNPMLYFDTQSTGHHPHHMAVLALHLVSIGKINRIVFSGPTELKKKAFAEIETKFRGASKQILFHEIEESYIYKALDEATVYGRHRRCWDLALRTAKIVGTQRIYFSVLDDVLLATATASNRSVKVAGLLFRGSSLWAKQIDGPMFGIRDRIREAIIHFSLNRKCVTRIFTLDKYFYKYFKAKMVNNKLIYVPEPFDAPTVRVYNLAHHRRKKTRFIFFGAMQKRKGILPLLEAIQLLPSEVKNTSEFRFCGEGEMLGHLQARLPTLRQQGVEATIVGRFLQQAELEAEIAASDVVLAPYLRHVGSSGVLLLAAAFRKPILTQQEMLIGAEVRRYRLGEAVNTADPQAIADGICRLHAMCRAGCEGEGRAFEEFLAQHGEKKFAECIVEGLLL